MTISGSSLLMDYETSCLPCTPEEEKQIINKLSNIAESNLKEGDLYFVISNRWFKEWQEYVKQHNGDFPVDECSTHSLHANGALPKKVDRPGKIDNSFLILNEDGVEGGDLQLKRTLEEGHDYVLVHQEVWKKLYSWYKGGPAIPRKLISQGFLHKTFIVEVYPLSLQVLDARDNKKFSICMSKKSSVQELYNKVAKIVGLHEENIGIWDFFNKRKNSLLFVSDKTLEEVNLQMDQDILFEVQLDASIHFGSGMDSTGNRLALVPIESSRLPVTIAAGPAMSNGYSLPTDMVDGSDSLSTISKGDFGGLAGLQNLGNTCFMNSAIQCLVHTPPLVEYFLQDYSHEINKHNPIGMHGELAIAFGDLLRKLWSFGQASIAPRAFKGKLARFAPQFSGYNQHDSHELLAFLLDGLHEDLNRVKSKPYFETRDGNGRPDEEVAGECWDNHKARNDSIIVDICQGQYKSTLVCPVCSKVSVTFDPFMYLSLPLPSTVKRSMTVTVFSSDGAALPMPYTVTVLKHGFCKDLFQAVSTACCLKSDESLLLAEVYGHRIYRYFENPFEPLSMIKDAEHIAAYKLPKNHKGLTKLEIIHRSKEKYTSNVLDSGVRTLLGAPLVSCLPEDATTGADIQNAVRLMLSPLLKTKADCPLIQIYSSKESVFGSHSPQSELTKESMDKMDTDQEANGKISFHLSLTDERGSNCSALENEFCIRQGQFFRVLLDWTDSEHDLYDISYLKDLPEVQRFTAKKTRPEATSLFSCLEAFLKEEPLGPDDMWYCPNCKEHRQATKKLDLWRLPEILVVHLKRFSYNRYLKDKLDTFVNFPIRNLDLSKYIKSNFAAAQSHIYELYAISNHSGGLGGGHYTAYVKLVEGNRWYDFDDANVHSISEDDIRTRAAYVLFYRRVKVESQEDRGEQSEAH
ncbi:hypothetical protein Syun_007432 [Stephania yunnanensis]|uniref:Ubiquitin carboxyl-terminal hydrolase n=1 Tax=Stephania yunnanensis TaxID=152371 RepID=A0AAP0KYK9_9MAGN